MATMKKMVAKKATKKYNNGGEVTMKDKTNTVVRDKDNSDFLNREKDKSDNSSKSYNSEVNKTKTDNSVVNSDRSNVKYKIAKGATVSFTAKSGRTIKKAQVGMPVPPKTTAKTPATTTPATTTNPRKGLTSNTQPVNAAGEVTTGMANPYKSKNGGRVMKKAQSGASLKDIPAGNKGLPNLPKPVRNKMGFKKNGGMTKPMMKMGGTVKKAMSGYGGKAASMVPMKKGGVVKKAGMHKMPNGKMMKNSAMKSSGKMKKAMMGSTMMAKPMMKAGGKMTKCKYGCN